MKFKLLVVLLLSSMVVKACDVCGIFMGITPYDNQSSIGIYYRYRAFNGYNTTATSGVFTPDGSLRNAQPMLVNHHDAATNVYSSKDYEVYRTVECRAKYYIQQRIELNFIVPYRMNSQSMNAAETKVAGIGDVNLYAGYHLIRKIETDKVQHRLIVGAGIKLPTGDYKLVTNEERVDPLIQPGSGSNDGFFYTTYITGYKNLGFNSTLTYKINGTNSLDEKLANSTTVNASLFYKFKAKNKEFTVIPKALLYYEYTEGLFVNHTYVPGTKMNVLMLGTGFDIFIKNFLLSLTVDLPVYENQEPEAMVNSGRFSLSLIYNINQKKYLFN
jgi:hypothetical protein